MAQSTSDPTYENQEHYNNPSDSAANSTPNNQSDESDKDNDTTWNTNCPFIIDSHSRVAPPGVTSGSIQSEENVTTFFSGIEGSQETSLPRIGYPEDMDAGEESASAVSLSESANPSESDVTVPVVDQGMNGGLISWVEENQNGNTVFGVNRRNHHSIQS